MEQPQLTVMGDSSNNRAHIAVIAVHGVGNQSPGESARQVSDLLSNLESATLSDCVHYTAFQEEPIAVVVERVNTPCSSTQNEANQASLIERTLGPFNAFATNFANKAQPAEESQARPAQLSDQRQDYQFMLGQLRDYKVQPAEKTYRSVRLQGMRNSCGRKTDVDVYELYWKDLASLGQSIGVATLFGEFYQLLFHLTSLGCQAIRGTLVENPLSRWWLRFTNLQNWASLILTVAIPILNLLLFGIAVDLIICSALVDLDIQLRGLVESFFIFSVFLSGVAWVLLRKVFDFWQLIWWLSIIVFTTFLISGLLLAAWQWSVLNFTFSSETIRLPANVLIPMFLLVPIGLLLRSILTVYDKQRPGVIDILPYAELFLFLGTLCSLIYFAGLSSQTSAAHFGLTALVQMIKCLGLLLEFSWLGFFLLLSCAHITGSVALKTIPAEKRERARLSRWTARFTLSFSGLTVFVVTFALWTLVAAGMSKVCDSQYLGEKPATLLNLSWGNALCAPLLLVAFIVAALDVWALAPSAWSDVFPPNNSNNCSTANRESRAMGRWMTNGNLLIRWSGRLLYTAVFLLFPLTAFFFLKSALPAELQGPYSAIILAPAVGFVALGSRINRFAVAFRPALSIILEIDNYFREHPLNSNPRARIAARYVSLLRHLCTSRELGSTYDAILIVAHSQGSAITADLLRFIRGGGDSTFGSGDPRLEALEKSCPIYLFTMGSPLRQYYDRLFPDLYKWMSTSTQPSTKCVPDGLPDPIKLGVKSWTNAFRSGDYVGRQLWLSNDCPVLFDIPSPRLCAREDSPSETQKEFCIGKGGHVHYWDATAGLIAVEIDRLIDLASHHTRVGSCGA